MEIKTHTISITENELETLGEGLCLYLKEEAKMYKTFNSFKFVNEEDLDLLQGLMNCGYCAIHSNGDWKDLRSKRYTDSHEWAKVTYNREKVAKK